MAKTLDTDGYGRFATELRDGGFNAPAGDSWPAEFVAAHVTLNNDSFTDTARRVMAGEQPTYDNEAAVEYDELAAYVARVGGPAELAAEVERSAAELAAAYAAMDDSQAELPVLVRIHHDGNLIVDEPRPIAAMIEGNASFHLQMHLEQMLALRA